MFFLHFSKNSFQIAPFILKLIDLIFLINYPQLELSYFFNQLIYLRFLLIENTDHP